MANQIDRELVVRHVRAATHEVFETMLGMQIVMGIGLLVLMRWLRER